MGLCSSKIAREDDYIKDDDITKINVRNHNDNYSSFNHYLFTDLKKLILKLINKISNNELQDFMLIRTNPKIRNIEVFKYSNNDMRGIIFDFVDGNHLEIYISAMSFFKNEDISILKISCNGNTLFFPQTKMAMYNFTSYDNNLIILDDTMLISEIKYYADYITDIYTPVLMNILTDFNLFLCV